MTLLPSDWEMIARRREENPGMQFWGVTKTFVGGTLRGITISEVSPVPFEVGKEYRHGIRLGSPYRVTECWEIPQEKGNTNG